MPFSFKEAFDYLCLNGRNVAPDELIFDYINWGGFPLRFSFQREKDIKTYLEQTYDGILEKDIITERSKINREKFIKIAGYIMANAGKEFSAGNIEQYFETVNNDSLDKKMVYRYLEKMEKACLINRVKRFHIVGRQAMAYNVIYNELIVRGYEVFTGKTYKGEVDFVVIDGKKKCFIQVSCYLNGQQTIEREFGAFRPISDASPKYVLSLDKFDFSRNGIQHINIVDFLMEKKDIVLT